MELHPIFYIKSVIQDCLVFNIPNSVRGIAVKYDQHEEIIRVHYFLKPEYLTHHTDVVGGAFYEVKHEIDFIKEVEVDYSVRTEMIIELPNSYEWIYFAHEDL